MINLDFKNSWGITVSKNKIKKNLNLISKFSKLPSSQQICEQRIAQDRRHPMSLLEALPNHDTWMHGWQTNRLYKTSKCSVAVWS